MVNEDEFDESGFLKDIDVQAIKEPQPKTSDKCRDVEQFFGPVVKQAVRHQAAPKEDNLPNLLTQEGR